MVHAMKAAEKSSRYLWMDILRGSAILLVINLHTYAVLSLKYDQLSPQIGEIVRLTTPFRMPLLMFLSGLLVYRSLQKGAFLSLRGKLENILYPYYVWSFIMLGLFFLREVFLHKPSEATLAGVIMMEPLFHLWYLKYLFFFYVAHVVLKPVNKTVILAISAALFLATMDTDWDRVTRLFMFFSIGVAIGQRLEQFSTLIRQKPSLSISAIALLLLTFMLFSDRSSVDPILSVLAILIIIPLIRVFMLIDDWRLAKPLVFIGQNSIVYYLAHMPLAMILPLTFQNIIPEGSINIFYPVYYLAVVLICTVLVVQRSRSVVVDILFSPDALLRRLGHQKKDHRQGGSPGNSPRGPRSMNGDLSRRLSGSERDANEPVP